MVATRPDSLPSAAQFGLCVAAAGRRGHGYRAAKLGLVTHQQRTSSYSNFNKPFFVGF